MLVLVLGGSASGKSAHAEKILCQRATGRKAYLATMRPHGAKERIARHRAMRAGKGFETIERSCDLCGMQLAQPYDGVLLEDLGNLLANEMFTSQIATPQQNILAGIAHLQTQCNLLVVVSNAIFSDGYAYDEQSTQYIQALAQLHDALAVQADEIYESVCGILVQMKGGGIS